MSSPFARTEPDPFDNEVTGYVFRPLIAEAMNRFDATGSYYIPRQRVEELAPEYGSHLRQIPEYASVAADPERLLGCLAAAAWLAAQRASSLDLEAELDLELFNTGGFDDQI